MAMETKTLVIAAVIIAATAALAIAPSLTSVASAAIHPKDTGCKTHGGTNVDSKTTCPGGEKSTQEQQTCNANSGKNEKCVPGLNRD
jgi:hypothetical protein